MGLKPFDRGTRPTKTFITMDDISENICSSFLAIFSFTFVLVAQNTLVVETRTYIF